MIGIWVSQDNNIVFVWSKVSGFKLWPAGSSGGSSYPCRLAVYVDGAEIMIRDERDITHLLSCLRQHLDVPVPRV